MADFTSDPTPGVVYLVDTDTATSYQAGNTITTTYGLTGVTAGVYTVHSHPVATYNQSTGLVTTYTGATEVMVLADLLVDLEGNYLVDSLGTRINLGGGYTVDTDTPASYTVGQ